MRTTPLSLLGILFLLPAVGCTVGPDYRTPEPQVSPAFAAAPPGVTTRPADLARWWTSLNDPLLNSLVDRAVQSNLDLKITEARVREARALRGVVAADAWPQLGVSGSYSYKGDSLNARPEAKTSGAARKIQALSSAANALGMAQQAASGGTGLLQNMLSQASRSTAGQGASIPREQNLFQAGFDATWELDVFGGVRREVEAAEADVQVAQESHRDVLVSLLSEVARNYVEARGFQQRIEIARQNIEAQQEVVELASTKFDAGVTSELDVTQARAQLANTRAAVPVLETQMKRAVHRLGVLLGGEPAALLVEMSEARPIPKAPPDIPAGLPSDLLRRRPDIRRSERELAAATARIGAATADLFPKFSLTGKFATQTHDMKYFLDANSLLWSVGPSVSWPIFDAGRIRANIAVQNARQEQAARGYESAVLAALEEVENSLVACQEEAIRQHHLIEAADANRRAMALANERYVKGLDSFLGVLDSERSLYASEDQLAASETTAVTSLIALYKALGGGWEVEDGATIGLAQKPFQNP